MDQNVVILLPNQNNSVMKKLSIAAAILFIGITAFAQQSFQSEKLALKWETPRELKVPESVLFDESRNQIYVSCIDGSPTDADGNGYLALVSPEGKIKNAHWVTGLNAPKGMGVHGNFLYVSDIDRVIKIDISTAQVVESVEIPGSKFLNDIAVDPDGSVYVSDMRDNAIYAILNGQHRLVVKSEKLDNPNGLFFENGLLLAGLQDRIVSVKPVNGEIKDLVINTGGIDGLVADGKGGYIISDWLGNVHLVKSGTEKLKLLDTTEEKVNAADIDYSVRHNLLLIPTFSDNRVMAYEIR